MPRTGPGLKARRDSVGGPDKRVPAQPGPGRQAGSEFPEAILHIGRHKSGTSSLQAFLAQNSEALREQGFLYPNAGLAGRAHHRLVSCFKPGNGAANTDASELIASLRAEAEGFPGTVLISSEGFQNAAPRKLAAVFAPGRTTIIVYLREQAGYAVSAYQQKVHAGALTDPLGKFAGKFSQDYLPFINKWVEVYGVGRVVVRAYDRKHLLDGDIIADFCHVARLDGSRLAAHPADRNPSIGGPLLELKRMVNAVFPSFNAIAPVYKTFGAVALQSGEFRAKPVLAPDVLQAIVTSCGPSNLEISQRFFGGRSLLAPQTPSSGGERRVSGAELASAVLAVRRKHAKVGWVVEKSLGAFSQHLKSGGKPGGFAHLSKGDARLPAARFRPAPQLMEALRDALIEPNLFDMGTGQSP